MERKSYSYLKSGSDVRGVAIKSADYDVTLTTEAVSDITKAFLKWLSRKTGRQSFKIAAGIDVRLSSDRIFSAVKKSVLESGCDLVYCGLCSTPSMFMLLKKSDFGCDASIMITASHLPYDKNGLKFFTAEGGLSGKDIEDIIDLAERGERLPRGFGKYEEKSYMDEYCNLLVETVRQGCGSLLPFDGHKIIIDAGNGAGGFFAKKVLQQLGADTEGSLFLEPDGLFPNHIPNPESKEAIEGLSKAVISRGAELGIIFDTDVDRAGAVDADGREINRNTLIALISAIVLKDGPATIVTDSVTSDGLTEFIKARGGKHVRFKRGYKNVIDEAIRRNAAGEYCPLAIETSGHAAFLDNYFLDDGAYLVCKLLIAFARQTANGEKLCDLISDLSVPCEEAEVRITFNNKSADFRREGTRVIDELTYLAEVDRRAILAEDNYDGVRINFGENDGDGWILVRMSVHDPVLPVNFESMQAGGNKIMAKKLLGVLRKYPYLDVSPLQKFIET